MTEIREPTVEKQIASEIAGALGMPAPVNGEVYWLLQKRMDAVLAIPEIKEGQELREKAESGKLVELEENQSYPNYTWLDSKTSTRVAFVHKADWDAGFRRVKVEG